MTALRRMFIAGVTACALGGLVVPTAVAATGTAQPAPATEIGVRKTWHATVQCHIVRISDNHVIGYDRADGVGNTKDKAITDAERNVPVPHGHYKRHCDPKRIW